MIIIKNKKLELLIIVIIILYSACYYVACSGYYEYHMQERTILTNEKIKEFEKDVNEGKDIDIKEYLVDPEADYTNSLTNLVYSISNNGTKLTRKIIKLLFKKISYLMEEE